MAQCNFSIPFSGNASTVMDKVKSELNKQGGDLTGNETGGSFNVSVFGSTIQGSYNVTGSSLNVVIESKPMFVTCGQIESFMKNYIK